jgi:hypothetical protein
MSQGRDIQTVDEVAEFLRVSTSWVYRNWKELGGRKIGGKLFFGGKEQLYEYLFRQEQGMALRFPAQRQKVQPFMVQNKNSSKKGNGQAQRGNKKSKEENRHGLL